MKAEEELLPSTEEQAAAGVTSKDTQSHLLAQVAVELLLSGAGLNTAYEIAGFLGYNGKTEYFPLVKWLQRFLNEDGGRMGIWRVGSKVGLNVYEGDRPVCQCHNGDDAKAIMVAVNAYAPLVKRVHALEVALRDRRQGYLDILKNRHLDGEKWAQRDGYGGRYGALTREEIELVIAEIDAALNTGGDR